MRAGSRWEERRSWGVAVGAADSNNINNHVNRSTIRISWVEWVEKEEEETEAQREVLLVVPPEDTRPRSSTIVVLQGTFRGTARTTNSVRARDSYILVRVGFLDKSDA